MTDSIIVYRNPLEQAFWESGLVGPTFIWGCISVFTIWAFFLVWNHCVVKFNLRRRFRRNIIDNVEICGIALALFASFAIVKWVL